MNNNRVLVTGADGFIGSHLVELLLKEGRRVKAFVYYNSNNSHGWLDQLPPEVKKEIEVFSGDIRDPHGVNAALEGCEEVFHLAALIGIPYSYHSPATYIETNVTGTLNVLMAARNRNFKRVIHTSTSEVYGTAQFVPITEEHPLVGQSPYSASKIGADQMAHSFFCSFGLPVTIVRPFNTYGPRQSARAVIPTIITQIVKGSRELKLGSLQPTRDFNYVTDTAKGFIEAAKSEKTIGEVVNVGSNFEISIGDTLREISSIMKTDVHIVQDSNRIRPEKSEVERLFSDNSKLQRLSNWKPDYAGLEGFRRGLEKTINWFTDPKNLSVYKTDVYNV